MPRNHVVVFLAILVLGVPLPGCNESKHSVGNRLQCRFESMSEADVVAAIATRLHAHGFQQQVQVSDELRRGHTTLRIEPMTHNFVRVDWTVRGRSDAKVQEEYDDVVELVRMVIQEVEAADRSLENQVSERLTVSGGEPMSVETDIYQNPDGRFCLTVMEASDQTEAVFEEFERQGGGYTWEGIAGALIEAHLADRSGDFEVGAEADNMYVYSSKRASLEALEALIVAIDSDEARLREVLESAGESIE